MGPYIPSTRKATALFSVAYVILPFSSIAPAEAVGTSLAPFQRGGRDDLPESQLTFEDETGPLQAAHEATFTFTDQGSAGLKIEGDTVAAFYVDTSRVREAMRRRGCHRWQTRFADTMDLDTFVGRYAHRLDRHPATGRYGHWHNPIGHWDWWDLGGRFDGLIIGDPARASSRIITPLSSGDSPGRTLLTNLEDHLGEALNHPPPPTIDIQTNRNIELVATLLTDARAAKSNAFPATLVLPPGTTKDRTRWLTAWPQPGPPEALTWLGLSPDTTWRTIVTTTYGRYEDHWAAAVAYHH